MAKKRPSSAYGRFSIERAMQILSEETREAAVGSMEQFKLTVTDGETDDDTMLVTSDLKELIRRVSSMEVGDVIVIDRLDDCMHSL